MPGQAGDADRVPGPRVTSPEDIRGDLRVHLDVPLPAELGVGAGTALFVGGWCVAARARIRALALVIDGAQQPVMAYGMPRLDVLRALHPGLDPYATRGLASDPASEDDPLLLGYRSGFWGMARVPSSARREVVIGLRADLEDGGEARAELARIPVAQPLEPVAHATSDGAGEPLVAICMATYEPP